MENETVRPKPNNDDLAEYILACHDGDAKAAIEAMSEEIEHLQAQLALAAHAMGRGFTRGWMPNGDRDSAS